MGYTKYNLSELSIRENDLKNLTVNIENNLDKLKKIEEYIDFEIKVRDNIRDQFIELRKELENIVKYSLIARQINKAIIEYGESENEIYDLINGLDETVSISNTGMNSLGDDDDTQKGHGNYVVEFFKTLYDKFIKNEITHVFNFLQDKKIAINNENYQDKVVSTDLNNKFNFSKDIFSNYNNMYSIKSEINRDKFLTSTMVGIDEFLEYKYFLNNKYKCYNFNNYSCVSNESNKAEEEEGFSLFGINIKDLTRSIIETVIANPLNVYMTQNPNPISYYIFNKAGFIIDDKGIYHARQDALQQYGGYNDFYDLVFDYATSMREEKFEFVSQGREYVFWSWKGDYLNLGAGAEMGIYSNEVPFLWFDITSPIDDHWLVDTNLAMPMTLTLKDKKGNIIAKYNPDNPQWWITAFNPNKQDVEADDLIVTYTIDFTKDKTMFNDFKNALDIRYDRRWSFDNYIATFKV